MLRHCFAARLQASACPIGHDASLLNRRSRPCLSAGARVSLEPWKSSPMSQAVRRPSGGGMEIAAPERDDSPVDPDPHPTISGGERGFGGVAEGGTVVRI